ncbi:hypothetical protein WR25_20564 [Diploscapter pachys]|uniref:Uncharacterized protein n=1 Tax=Diploscapter pachys TaxID=2018661 RepID=A0A2A2JST7_9BILA|nr:hypothetical protein WR25_20564 [Diploscapter pachys]
MYSQQAAPRAHPNMQPAGVIHSQNDQQAREKLACYVYEYMLLSGATKSAEAFKEEVINSHANANNFKPTDKGQGFLQEWWTMFWDLYCAAPERRDMSDMAPATQEAKMFADNFVQPYASGPQAPMMNGMQPGGFHGAPPGMGMPPEGMMSGFPPARFAAARGPQPGMPPGGFTMFPDPRMANSAPRMPPNAMRMPPQGTFVGGPPPAGMRPMTQPQPGMRYGGPPFIDSPGQSFPPGGMMPNGGVMCSQPQIPMSSPGMPPTGPDNPMGAPYMMSMPTSSSAMPFGMGDTSVTMGNGNGPSGGMGGPGSTDNGQGGMGQGPNGPVGNAPGSVTGPQMGQAVTGLINGEDMKVGLNFSLFHMR